MKDTGRRQSDLNISSRRRLAPAVGPGLRAEIRAAGEPGGGGRRRRWRLPGRKSPFFAVKSPARPSIQKRPHKTQKMLRALNHPGGPGPAGESVLAAGSGLAVGA